ncbi:MAG: sterol desaturase family protein [Pseudomonadota bacterium]
MEHLFAPVSVDLLTQLEVWLSEWFLVLSLLFLAFEFMRYALRKSLNGRLAADTATNFLTTVLSYGITYLLLGVVYLSGYAFLHQFALVDIPITWATVALCIVVADFAYYWEHRFSHHVGIAWATHTVHHSSPHYNLSVAYRFGPMDGLWPLFFHAPLVLLGFDPFLVFFSEAMVQLYQTFLHTETIKKLPKPIEAVFNTPSHHRVHHGSNAGYMDKNYGGIFIFWDRLFGTFAEEQEKVVFGITQPINSVNPLVVFFHGLTRLAAKVRATPGIGGKLAVLFMPPDHETAPKAAAQTVDTQSGPQAPAEVQG